MNVIEQLRKLGRALLLIDTSPIRGRAKFNRINRAVADMLYFALTNDFSSVVPEGGKSEVSEAQDYLQELMEHMSSGSWRLQRVIDAIGANL